MDGADAISPQLCGAHYALPPSRSEGRLRLLPQGVSNQTTLGGPLGRVFKERRGPWSLLQAPLESEVKLVAEATLPMVPSSRNM
jgi:hypothetical protein